MIKRVWSEDNHDYMYQADYRVKLPDGRLKRKRKLFFTKAAAEKAIRQDKVKAEAGEYRERSKITLKVWKDKVMNYVKTHRKGSTIITYDVALSVFNEVIGEERKIESLSRTDLQRFVDFLRNRKKQDSTTRIYYSKVKAALNLIPQLFDDLLFWLPPTYRFEAFSKPRERVLNDAEIIALLNQMPQDMQDILLVALNTGGRLKEVLTLRWDAILWDAPGYEHGALKLRVTKVRGLAETYRIVYATKEVRSILDRRKVDSSPSPYVFPSPRNPKQPRADLIASLKNACKAAKIIYGRDVKGGFVFHDLRRTAVTYLRRAGIDIETVCSITGHSEGVMLKVYSKSNLAAQKDAMEKLASVLPFGQFKESKLKRRSRKNTVKVKDSKGSKTA
jgi:integrase